MGISDKLSLVAHSYELDPGDSLVMFTDGCIGEGGDSEVILGAGLSERAGASATDMADAVITVAASLDQSHPDDIAVLVARIVN